MQDDHSEFEKLSFIGTILIGCTAMLGMILAAAILGNGGALGLALGSAGLAYVDQMLITWELQHHKQPSWFVVALGLMAMVFWIFAGIRLLYGL